MADTYDAFLDLPEGPQGDTLDDIMAIEGIMYDADDHSGIDDIVYDADDHDITDDDLRQQLEKPERPEQERRQDIERRRQALIAKLKEKLEEQKKPFTQEHPPEHPITKEIREALYGADADRAFSEWMTKARSGMRIPREAQAALYDYYRIRTVELLLSNEIGTDSPSEKNYMRYLLPYIPETEKRSYMRVPGALKSIYWQDVACGLVEHAGLVYAEDPDICKQAEERLDARGVEYTPFEITYLMAKYELDMLIGATHQEIIEEG